MADNMIRFFRAWLADPFRVAAVAPSGPALARLITAEIGPETGPVIELGPGTGAFTRALIARGVAQSELTLIESGPEFVALLSQHFPALTLLPMDADRLRFASLFAARKAGATVSGLPLLSMPARKILAILIGAFANMHGGGAFYQFTYGPKCPIPRPILDRLGLRAVRTGFTLANVPPATVYRLTRRPTKGLARRLTRQRWDKDSGLRQNLSDIPPHPGRMTAP